MMAIDLLEQILPHIKESIYPVRKALPDWRMKEGEIKDAASVSLNDKSWTSIRVPFHWGKYDKIYWFRQTINVPPEFAGKPLVLLLDFPEALIYINEKPFQGIDQHHNEILIREKAKPNEQIVIAIQAYSGKKHEHSTFSYAELALLDTTARRLSSGLSILQEFNEMLEHGSQESKEIRELIRRTLIYLKYFKPGSEEYPNAIRRAYNFLLNTLETECKTTSPGLIHLIGHSRINSLWSWTPSELLRKQVRTFTSALRLMEEFPEFKFSYGQPVFYESIKTNYTDTYRQIKQRITEGKWDPLGSMWTEADCNIPNGESLIRQILYGKRFLKQEFGIDGSILWLPDSFGFSASLPQVMAKCGISGFYTSLISSDETSKLPHSSFQWQGIDKTKILAHISEFGSDAQITPNFITKSLESLQEQNFAAPVLQTYGYGDIGPTKENLENAVILKTIVGLPPSQLTTVQDFFKQLHEHFDEFPVFNGELFINKNRGVFTNQSWIKKENRECETLLYNTELLSAVSMMFGKNASSRRYPHKELEVEWKKLLFNQSGYILSGTCREENLKEVRNNYESVRNFCSSEIDRCINGICQPVNKNRKEFLYTLFNPLGWQRNEYIELLVKSSEKHLSVRDSSGESLPHQVVERTKKWQKLLFFVEKIPPYGFTNIVINVEQKSVELPDPWKSTSQAIETPFYRVRLNRKGEFSSIYAKFLHRELFQKGKCGNHLAAFHDTSKEGETWNIDPEYEKHKVDIWKLKQMKISTQGPLRSTIHAEYKTGNGSVILQDIHFYHRSQRIDFQTRLHWQEEQTLLKVAFPFNIRVAGATYEIPFGSISRPSKMRGDNNLAKLDVPAQQWADLSDAKYGISLLNDCKYGCDAQENTLRLTLIRSPRYPGTNEQLHSKDDFVDQGDQTFCYALYPHNGSWLKGETVHRAQEFNHPILVCPDVRANEIPPLVILSKPNIIIESIKKAEEDDSVIIRAYEAHGILTDTTFHFGVNIGDTFECDLLENNQKQQKVVKSKLTLKFKPFEIKTIKFTVKGAKKVKGKK